MWCNDVFVVLDLYLVIHVANSIPSTRFVSFPLWPQLLCSGEDLKELGIPLGPRKKLASYITQELERQRVEKVGGDRAELNL